MEKTREQIRDELIREFRENEAKFQAAMRALEEDPHWKELQDRTVIDWKDGREKILNNGMSVQKTFSEEEWVLERQEHCLVRNFPKVIVKDASLNDCIFENCDTVELMDGTATKCVFAGGGAVWMNSVKMSDCNFQGMHGRTGSSIVDMDDSSISGCSFSDIQIVDDNYLIDGIGDCTVEKCSFERVRSEREDGELFFCQEFVGKLVRRLRECAMVDWSSCTGLE